MGEKELILFNDFKITSADTDMQGRLRLGALTNLYIQSAINSANQLGFGFSELGTHNLFWVLSRLTMEIYRPLTWNEDVVVETWPKDLDKLFYLRDFILRDNEKNIVGKATSAWLAIDILKKRPKIIQGLNSELFSRLKNKHAIVEHPQKLAPLIKGQTFVNKVSFFDIDLNKHVTSTRYIDWMMDAFPLDFHNKNYPKKLSINYLKETMPESKMQITKDVCDNTFIFEGLNLSNENIAFRGKIEF